MDAGDWAHIDCLLEDLISVRALHGPGPAVVLVHEEGAGADTSAGLAPCEQHAGRSKAVHSQVFDGGHDVSCK